MEIKDFEKKKKKERVTYCMYVCNVSGDRLMGFPTCFILLFSAGCFGLEPCRYGRMGDGRTYLSTGDGDTLSDGESWKVNIEHRKVELHVVRP